MLREPVSARLMNPEDGVVIPWPEARWRLEKGGLYWLSTVSPDGKPHVMPLLVVWIDDALFFCAGGATRKAKNLASTPSCAVTTASHAFHLVVEGQASKVRDDETLRKVAAAYYEKYDWMVEIRDGAFFADGAPTAGPPPYEVYRVTPQVVFAFSEDASFSATRWQFS